jgi:hypothetical protein
MRSFLSRASRLALVLVPVGVSFFACGGDVDPVQFTEDAGRPRRDSGAEPIVDASTMVDSGGVKDSGLPKDAGKDSSAMTCPDPSDLGGLDSPKQLPAITDSDANPAHFVEGIMSSATDKDAYSVFGEDTTFARVGLTAKVNVADVEICMFMKCKNGSTLTLNKCNRGTRSTDPVAGEGCCDPMVVEPDYNCSGANDSVNFELHVKAKAPICQAYKLEYNM